MNTSPKYSYCFDSQWFIRWNIPAVRDGKDLFEHEMLLDFDLLDQDRTKKKSVRKHLTIGFTDRKLNAGEKVRFMCTSDFQETLRTGIIEAKKQHAGYSGNI
ncbi:MAG TPA: hypothetical protein VJ934_06115 [Desulfomicrobiaceae bacterium]|nr:hypothetical protein [Desulfomicrobiaceae bacterium]